MSHAEFHLRMKLLISSLRSSKSILFRSCTLFCNHQNLVQSPKPFSSSSGRTTKWNSDTNVIITHPTLLIMESCTSMIQLKQIQAHMTRTGLMSHAFPFSRVLAFCALADSGDVDHAHVLFRQFENPNTYMWNTMIRGYSKAQLPILGFSFFCHMVRERVELDCRSFVFALKACERFLGVLVGESVHCTVWKMGFVCSLLIQNALIHFYSVQHSYLGFARQLFDEIPVRDVFSWTSMIDGYSAHGCYNEALELFDCMCLSGIEANEVTMIAVLSACSQKNDLRLGMGIHDYVKKNNVSCSQNLMNALLDMYVKCGYLTAAREVFDGMAVKDVFTWTTIVYGYAKGGELDLARKFFDAMPERNVVSWNAMIAGYSQNGRPKQAVKLFYEMIDAGLAPMETTLACVLSACGQLGYLDLGQWIHIYHINQEQIEISMIIANALIDMYAKCGAVDAAAKIFYDMPERNLVSWNSMIAAYAAHGHAKQALTVFEQMRSERIRPDDITFVSVLAACSHAGLVTEGRKLFQSMKKNHDIEPKGEHYACMVDILGRVGLLEDAYELITNMPMKPPEAAWGALLNACRMHGNVELAKLAAKELLDLNPEDGGIYLLLASTLAKGGKWDDLRDIQTTMREKGVEKIPGHSFIEVESDFHELKSEKGPGFFGKEI